MKYIIARRIMTNKHCTTLSKLLRPVLVRGFEFGHGLSQTCAAGVSEAKPFRNTAREWNQKILNSSVLLW